MCTLYHFLKVVESRAGHGSAVSLLKTIGRLGNASREKKSALVFAMLDK
jgi:hypothetical protein